MSEKKKAEEGFLYNANYNAALLDERAWCKDQCHLCNQLRPSDTEKRYQIYHSLFKQMGKHVSIEPPFWCDYGYHISMSISHQTAAFIRQGIRWMWNSVSRGWSMPFPFM